MNALPAEIDDEEIPKPEDQISTDAAAFWSDLSDRVLIQHENGAWSTYASEPVFPNVVTERLFWGPGSPMSIMVEHKTWQRLHSVIVEDGKPISHALLVPLYWSWGHFAVPNKRALAILTIWTAREHRGRGLANKCVQALNERIREGRFPDNGYLVVDHAAMRVARKAFDVPLEQRMNKYDVLRESKDSNSLKGYQASCSHCQTILGFFDEEESYFGTIKQCPKCEQWSNIKPPRRKRKIKTTTLFQE